MLRIDFSPPADALAIEFPGGDSPLNIQFEQTSGGGKPETTFSATPAAQRQVITPPEGYVFSGGVVEAIPRNYGLITYNGYELTVS